MGIFSSSKKEGELVLVFDIRSSSVGGTFFWAQKSGVPKIIYSIREYITIENELNINRLLSLTLKSLEKVASMMSKKGLGTPSKIFCVLSSPWYVSQTRTIRLEKDTPFIFTSKFADDLIRKEIVIFEEEYLNRHKKDIEKIEPIELKNMNINLNGYPTRNPFNQKAKELEMNIFISMSEAKVLESIKTVINKYFHIENIKFCSFAMASFTVSRDMFVHQESFMLVNIGGEITDISMIKKDVLRESLSYPMGCNFFVRNGASELKTTNDEAKSFLSLYKDGHMEKMSLKKIEIVMEKLKMEWLKKFQESLSNITNDISIPATIFITVDEELANFFSDIIKTEEFNQYTLTESKFRVIFLGTQSLHGIAIFDRNVPRDAFLIIEAIYINNFLV